MNSPDRDLMNQPLKECVPRGYDRRHVIFWFTLLTVLAAVAAYFRMMTEFSPWDDEGGLMFNVKQYMAGMKCYDEILSLYGPVYYFYQWVLHTVTATPVTHDVARISALLPWLSTALISGWMTLRLTRSLTLAALVHLSTSLALGFFQGGPSHPQELTVLLLVALAAAPVIAGLEDRRTPVLLAMGILPALLFLIKVNIGAYAVAAVAMTLLSCGPRTRAWRVVGLAAAAACIALPVILMHNHLDAEWARSYCWLVATSVAGCVFCLLRIRHRPLVTLQDCMLAAGGFAVTFAAVIAVLLAQGVSLAATYDALVAAPARIFASDRTWFRAPWILKGTSIWAMAGLGAAVFAGWTQPLRGSAAWRALFAGKTFFCAVAIVTIVFDRPLLSIVTPFAWLLLFDPNQAGDESPSLPRRLLSILAVLQTLYAYPIAGDQAGFIQILLLIAVGACVGDSVSWLPEFWRMPQVITHWSRGIATAALAGIALMQVEVGVDRYRIYYSLPSLDLPGARLVHVAPDIKATYQWLVENLDQQCDSFVALPGLPSLSFWTGIEPPTRFDIGAWTYTLSPEQQQQVVTAISSHPRACVVYNPRLTEFWNPGGKRLDDLPLVAYIFRNFHPVGASGDYQFMLRNERAGKARGR